MSSLPLSYQHSEKFLDLFYEPSIDAHELSVKTKLSLYVLRIDGGKFDYNAMYDKLAEAAVTYALSRSQYQKHIDEQTISKAVQQAKQRFKSFEGNDGEGGELLLYCFLEAHLGAPKVLSKMDLKTSAEHYVYGADGVHLLSLGDGSFHLIFGESKMISDSKREKGSSLRIAIADAFGSISEVEAGGSSREVELVDSNVMKESYDSSTLEHLKSIIMPSGRNKSTKKENAYGIFVGFEIDVTDWDVINMTSEEFENKVQAEVRVGVEARYDYILQKIKEYGLEGRHFYFYAVPFLKDATGGILEARRGIVERL